MRHPADQPLPHYIDAWAFAHNRSLLSGKFALAESHELKTWQSNHDIMQVCLEGYTDAEHRCHLKGTINVTLQMQCQRCLVALPWHSEIAFDYILVRNEAQEAQIDDGRETLICAEDNMNLAWFLEEEVLLAMPMIAKHEECELPTTFISESLAANEVESPFAQLKTLINNKEQP